MKASTLIFISLTTLASQAHASGPNEWAAYNKAVLASCTKASSLKNVKALGNPATPRYCFAANTPRPT